MKNVNELQSLIQKATYLRNNGREKEAIELYKEAMHKYQQMGEISKAAHCAHMIGVCFKILKQENEALDWFEKALDLYGKTGNNIEIGNIQRDVGLMYEYINQYEEAQKWLTQSETTLEKTEDKNAYGITLAKIGMVLTKKGAFTQAEEYLYKGLTEIRSFENRSWFMEMTTLWHLSALWFAQEKYQESLSFAREALGILYEEEQQGNQLRRIGQLHGMLAWCYLELGAYTTANEQILRAIKAWKGIDNEAKKVVFDELRVDDFLQELEDQNGDLGKQARNIYEKAKN